LTFIGGTRDKVYHYNRLKRNMDTKLYHTTLKWMQYLVPLVALISLIPVTITAISVSEVHSSAICMSGLISLEQLNREGEGTNESIESRITTTIRYGADYDYFPYEGVDERGNPAGLNPELIEAIANHIDFEIEYQLDVWSEVVNNLLTGDIDVVAMFKTPEREEFFDFSEPFTLVYHSIFIRDNSPPIRYMSDLIGKRVIIQESAATHYYFQQFEEHYDLILVESEPEAISLLAAGEYDCAVLSANGGHQAIKSRGMDNIISTGPPVIPNEYCFAVRKGNTELLELISDGLAEVKASGEFDQIRDRWLTVVTVEKPDLILAARYAIWILLPLALIAGLFLLWTLALRRAVQDKTRALRRELYDRIVIEEHLKRLNMLYDLLSHINHTLVRVEHREELFDEICRMAVKQQAFSVVMIATIDKEKRVLTPLAVEGSDIAEIKDTDFRTYVKKIAAFGIDNPENRDMCFFVNNIKTKHSGIIQPEFEKKHQIRSLAALPLYQNREFFGIFSLFSTVTSFFDEDEIRVLIEIAHDVSYALTIIDNEEQKRLLEEELVIAQKMESFGQLASGISHDFNNVLSIILGSITIILEKTDDPVIKNYLEIIEGAAKRGSDLSRRILSFVRKKVSVKSVYNINELLEGVYKTLQQTIGEDIDLNLKKDTAQYYSSGNSSELFQVLLNLCINAKDALLDPKNEKAEKTITISFSEAVKSEMVKYFPKVPGEDYVKITVSNNGPSIPPEIRQKIFDPFFTTKEEGKGTGLGLSMAYRIVNAHEGFINFESEPGRDTSFHVYLPTVEKPKEVEQEEDLSTVGTCENTILVVEDEIVLQELMSEILERGGFRVLQASDGQEALEIFQVNREEITVVIIDLGLPKISGDDLYHRIIEIEPEINIIVTSGYLEQGLEEELGRRSRSRYLMKPFKITMLQEIIAELTGK